MTTVTLNLPPDIEHSLLEEAITRGMSLGEFLSSMLMSGNFATGRTSSLEEEDGIPVLRTGSPLAAAVVGDTMEMLRREQEASALGSS